MRSTCAEPSLPLSTSALWLSVLFDFTPLLESPLQSGEAEEVASGDVDRVGVA